MTANKIKKKDLDILFKKIDIHNIDKNVLYSIKQVIENEVRISIWNEGIDKYITERNYICFNNMLKKLDENIKESWWELTDIISFHKEDDFISVDEIVLIDIALTLFISKL